MKNSYVGRPSSEVDILEPLIQPNLVGNILKLLKITEQILSIFAKIE